MRFVVGCDKDEFKEYWSRSGYNGSLDHLINVVIKEPSQLIVWRDDGKIVGHAVWHETSTEEPSVGFLHDVSDYQTQQSLVYDLEEPFRWIVDVSVIQAFESGTLSLHDFYFTGDDYRYRFVVEAKQRFIDLIRERFNSGVKHNGLNLKWDTVIEQKAIGLGRFLIGKFSTLDLIEPIPRLEKRDDRQIRSKVLALTASQAEQIGIGKSTLHYLRRAARDKPMFKIYSRTRERLGAFQ
jgi:CRISPR-associated protein Cas1